jgi:curved DNA-binding protein
MNRVASDNQEYYKILGVRKDASVEDMRKAYKTLARKYHPDANSDDASALEQFKRVQEAWSVLGDEEKRANYDKYGSATAPQFQGGPGAGGDPRSWGWSPEGGDVPFDIEELFGGFRTGPGAGPKRHEHREWPVRGHDVRAELQVPFQLAADGGKYDLQFQRPGSASPETLSVTIPTGVDTGSVIRLSGLGGMGSGGGAAGDLLVSIQVAPHPWFRREGSNILLDLPIGLTEAALGAKVEIPTLRDGTVVLTIPPGTSSGMRLRLREKGIVDRRTGRPGDQYAIVKIVPPKQLDDRSRELLEQLQGAIDEKPRAGLW